MNAMLVLLDQEELAVRIAEAMLGRPRPGPDPKKCLEAFTDESRRTLMKTAYVALQYMQECVERAEAIPEHETRQ